MTVLSTPSIRSTFLLRLAGFTATQNDPNEWRRELPRRPCRNIYVAMRSSSRPIRAVLVHDVSKAGISIITRDDLTPGEIVYLSFYEPVAPFERFRVVHVQNDGRTRRAGLRLDPQ